jgi:succinate-semialdehyde dehydrogenase/glutarate-semialdehyde dehydrogenase
LEWRLAWHYFRAGMSANLRPSLYERNDTGERKREPVWLDSNQSNHEVPQPMTLYSINPANGMLLRSYDTLSTDAVRSKIANAQRAFEAYSETPLEHRLMWMKKLAGILEQEMEELATLLTTETGKTIRTSREEVLQCAACCRYFAENATELLENETVEIDASRCTTMWRPMGVLFAVMPGTNPLWQVFRVAVPALLGGNAVVLKHAANVPQCAVEMELLLRRAGFAHGVFQALLMDSADTEIVLNDERITGVAVVGIQQTGREIAAHTAWMGKKAVSDQEGSGTFIVMPSANLFAAIQAGVAARCMDNGQSNDSTARFIVHESVYDEFALLFASAMEDVKIGNPLKDETELGPMATEESVRQLKAQIAGAVAAGGSILTGGEPMLGDGNYFEPTVLVEVPVDAPVCREEVYGPLALLFKVPTVQDAIWVANRACGSGVSVWTQDEGEKQQFGRRLTCGSVYLNSPMVMDARMASSSLKGAGCGRAMAAASLREFMTARTVVKANLIPGSEFNFDLTLREFEKEAQLAEADVAEETIRPEAFVPVKLEVEDDLFVMSQIAEIASASATVEPDVKVSPAAVAVAVDEEVVNFIEMAPAVAPKNVVVPEEITGGKKAAPSKEGAAPKKVDVAEQASVKAPLAIAEPLVIAPMQISAVTVAPQPAALSFKEMFERALMVRA